MLNKKSIWRLFVTVLLSFILIATNSKSANIIGSCSPTIVTVVITIAEYQQYPSGIAANRLCSINFPFVTGYLLTKNSVSATLLCFTQVSGVIVRDLASQAGLPPAFQFYRNALMQGFCTGYWNGETQSGVYGEVFVPNDSRCASKVDVSTAELNSLSSDTTIASHLYAQRHGFASGFWSGEAGAGVFGISLIGRCPTSSSLRPSAQPTRTTFRPTRSPTFQCPAGTYSSNSFGSPSEPCQLCGSGGYELANDTDATTCANLPCESDYWCGPGAVYGSSYRRLFDVIGSVRVTIILGADRTVFATLNAVPNSNWNTLFVNTEAFMDGRIVVNSQMLTYDTSNQHLQLAIRLVPPTSASLATPISTTLHLAGRLGSDPANLVTVRFSVDVFVEYVVVPINPSSLSYDLMPRDTAYDKTTLTPEPAIQIFNPICGTDLSYYITFGCATSVGANSAGMKPSWIDLAPNTSAAGLIPESRGSPDHLDLVFSFAEFSPIPEDYRAKAQVLTTCINVHYQLVGKTVTDTISINVSIALIKNCPKGTFSSSGIVSRESGCMPCAIGTYQDQEAQTQCKPCNDALPMTRKLGATSKLECTTNGISNTFQFGNTSKPCPIGALCDFVGAETSSLRLRPGFYRINNQSLDIRRCRYEQFCDPNAHQRNRTSSSMVAVLGSPSSSDGDSYCTPGHAGLLCESCLPGMMHRGSDRLCANCTREMQTQDLPRLAGILFAGSLVFIVLLILLILHAYTRNEVMFTKGLEHHVDEQPSRCVSLGKTLNYSRSFIALFEVGGVPLKITISYYQVVSGMAVGMKDYVGVLQSFSTALAVFSIDLPTLLDFGCASETNFFTSLLVSTLLPIASCLILFLCEQLMGRFCSRQSRFQVHRKSLHIAMTTAILWILFFVYPNVSTTILKTYQCDTFENGLSALVWDHSISCSSDTYKGYLAYAIFMTVFFIAGVPCLFLTLLYRKRHVMNRHPSLGDEISAAIREQNPDAQSTRMLWNGYRPSFYLVEVLELIRKLLQTSVFVFVGKRFSTQIIFLLFVTVVSIITINILHPFMRKEYTFLHQLSQWMIFTIGTGALLSSLDTTGELQNSLDVIFILCLVVIPFFAIVITILGYVRSPNKPDNTHEKVVSPENESPVSEAKEGKQGAQYASNKRSFNEIDKTNNPDSIENDTKRRPDADAKGDDIQSKDNDDQKSDNLRRHISKTRTGWTKGISNKIFGCSRADESIDTDDVPTINVDKEMVVDEMTKCVEYKYDEIGIRAVAEGIVEKFQRKEAKLLEKWQYKNANLELQLKLLQDTIDASQFRRRLPHDMEFEAGGDNSGMSMKSSREKPVSHDKQLRQRDLTLA